VAAKTPYSPDGRFWWDGNAWQPLFTPDGMWRWSGQEWVQLAEPFGVAAVPVPPPAIASGVPAASVVAAAAAGRPAGLDAAPSWLDPSQAAVFAEPAPSAVAEPYPIQAYAPPAPRSTRPYILLGGGLLVAAILFTGWIFRDQLRATPIQSDSSLQSPSPSPSGTEYERANHFLNGVLGPSIAEVNATLPGLQSACTPDLPPACRDAISATDVKFQATTKVIASADIPPCIATPMQQFNRDWSAISSGLELALSGFDNGDNKSLIVDGLQRVGSFAAYLRPDVNAVNNSLATCTK
jgi:hypothetical protein